MTADVLVQLVFWVGVCGILYAYVGFPIFVSLLGRPDAVNVADDVDPLASLTIVIPAYNEEASIGAKVRNTLETAYPRHLLEVLVVSDASTDRTDAIVRTFEHEGVRLIVQDRRRGKTAGLNRAVACARGEILVFTDANAEYQPDVLHRLARRLCDPRLGLVTGYTRYRRTDSGEVAEVTNAYTSLERLLKRAESRWGCCVGADGAIFAMRRSLYRPLRDDDINDFVLPLDVVDQGYGCVFAEDAYCAENPGEDLESEFRRQSRITNRTLRALWRRAHLLNPLRFPAFAFFAWSHKVARFAVPMFLCLCAAALIVLAPSHAGYAAAAVTAAVLLGASMAARFLPRHVSVARALQILSAFLIVNVAIADGWRKFLTGRADVVWQHDRSPVAHSSEL